MAMDTSDLATSTADVGGWGEGEMISRKEENKEAQEVKQGEDGDEENDSNLGGRERTAYGENIDRKGDGTPMKQATMETAAKREKEGTPVKDRTGMTVETAAKRDKASRSFNKRKDATVEETAAKRKEAERWHKGSTDETVETEGR